MNLITATDPKYVALNSTWWDLSLKVDPMQEDLIFWRLEQFGCQGMTSERQGEHLLLHAYAAAVTVSLLDLAALSLQLRQDALVAGMDPPQLHWEPMESEDWSSSWKAHWQPQEVGDRLLICPAWMEAPPHPNRHLLWMDPGMAFGTGVHPTTQLCLEALEMRLDGYGSSERSDLVIADIGCGSGILSIGAVLMGASRVFAADTDPLAIEATYANAQRNQVASQIQAFQGSIEQVPEMVDGLVCNILMDPILDIIPELKLLVKDDGWLILSGILVDQAKLVAETLEANDWLVSALWKRKEWCCLNVRMS